MMFEKFGEFDNVQELNKAAAGLKDEGDLESLKALAEENGIDKEDVEDYIDGVMDELATPATAALGKIEAESKDLGITGKGILEDWRSYIVSECLGEEKEKWQKAVRKKGKSLSECLAKLIEHAYKNQYTIPDKITETLEGIYVEQITSGTPSMAEAITIIKDYYLGGAK